MAICSGIVISLWAGFCPLLNIYFNNMQINRYIYLVVSGETVLKRPVQKKNRPEKLPFIATNKLNCIGCLLVCKIFFLFRIPRYSGKIVEKKKMEKTGKYKVFCF